MINASINNKNIYLVTSSKSRSYSNLNRESLILIVNIINFINLSSYFSVISLSRRIMLIKIISSINIRLARESLSYIAIIKKIKAINLRLRYIKVIKKTLVSRSQLR